jgi:hypothetical protein
MKRRNLLAVFILPIVTLGIYMIYWLASTKNEMNKKGEKVPTIWLIFLPFAALLAVAIAQIIFRFAYAENGTEAISALNIFSVLVGVVSVIALIPMAIYWLVRYCQAVHNLTKGELNFGLNFVLAILLGFVGIPMLWMVLEQYHFNELTEVKKK